MRRPARTSLPDQLPIESVVTATTRSRWWRSELGTEHRAVVELANRPVSLLEIAAALGVPVAVAAGLVRELACAGHLDVHLPRASAPGWPGRAVLARLLRGLRTR